MPLANSLSSAIRDGSSRTSQCFGSFIDEGATCALGAAFEHVIRNQGEVLSNFQNTGAMEIRRVLEENYPILSMKLSAIDDRYIGGTTVEDWLILLNDEKKYTREQIANVVEAIELKLAARNN
jgi:hypothetical protein